MKPGSLQTLPVGNDSLGQVWNDLRPDQAQAMTTHCLYPSKVQTFSYRSGPDHQGGATKRHRLKASTQEAVLSGSITDQRNGRPSLEVPICVLVIGLNHPFETSSAQQLKAKTSEENHSTEMDESDVQSAKVARIFKTFDTNCDGGLSKVRTLDFSHARDKRRRNTRHLRSIISRLSIASVLYESQTL